MRSIPPLNWLRAFESVARHRSFSLAAKSLNVTPSAISQHIKSLEDYLDTPLFIRSPKALTLTDTGKQYLPMVAQAFSQLETATGDIFDRRDDTVRVSCGIAFSTLFIAPRLPDFYHRHPQVQIQFHNNVWWERQVGQRDMLEIRYGDGNWAAPARLLLNDAVTPMVGANFPLPNADYQALQQAPLFQVSGLRHSWHEWLKAADIRPEPAHSGTTPPVMNVIKPLIYSDSAVLIHSMAVQNQGIALLSCAYASHAKHSGALVQPFSTTLPTAESFYLIQPGKPNAAELLFSDWLVQQCAAQEAAHA